MGDSGGVFTIGWGDMFSHLSVMAEPALTVFFGFLTATTYLLLTRKLLAPRIRVVDIIEPDAGDYTDSKYRFRVKNIGRWKIIDNRLQVRLLVHKKGTPLHWFNTEVQHNVPVMRGKSMRRFVIGNVERHDWEVFRQKYGIHDNQLSAIVTGLKGQGYRIELRLYWYGVDSLSGVLRLEEFDDLLAAPRFVPKSKSAQSVEEQPAADTDENTDENLVSDPAVSE